MNGSDLIGKSRIAISCCTISLPSKTPMNKTPKAPDPLPPVLADGRPGLILGVSGLMMSWFSWPRELRFSDASNADGARSLTPVPPMDGPDLIAVSRLEWPRCLVPRISETDDLVTRVPLQPDGLDFLSGFRDFRSPVSLALRISDSPIPDSSGSLATCPLDQRPMMVSETRVSRFRIARDHVLEIPDMPNSDSLGSSATCPYCLDGSDLVGVFTWISPSTCPRECRFPDGKYPDPTVYGISTPDLMAQITSSRAYPCA
jgi:hypothetical protein